VRTCLPAGPGRPSIPATQMAAVLTLQALHDYSDREAATWRGRRVKLRYRGVTKTTLCSSAASLP
jgi:hypothetical protein